MPQLSNKRSSLKINNNNNELKRTQEKVLHAETCKLATMILWKKRRFMKSDDFQFTETWQTIGKILIIIYVSCLLVNIDLIYYLYKIMWYNH